MDFNEAYQLVSEKLSLWLNAIIKLLPNILLAAVIIVLGMYVAKFIRKIAQKLIRKVSHNTTLNSLFGSFIYIAAIGVVFFAALSVLQLDKAVTTILAGAGILGLGLAFAFQDIAANLISGIFISFRKPVNIGDIVKVKDYMGKVEEINLRDTVVRTFQGQLVIIPNKDVFQNPIENYSMLGKRRIDLSVGISYGDDLQKVYDVTMAAVSKLKNLSPDDKTTMFFDEFAGSSINFKIRIWACTPEQPVFLQLRHDAIMEIKKAYDSNDIMIPYPIRTLDFGIKGGEKLSEMGLGS